MSVAFDAIEDIVSILEEEETSPEEKMTQISFIIKDYDSELLLSEETIRQEAVDEIFEAESVEDETSPKPILSDTTKAFLRSKAELEYFAKIGYSEDEITNLSAEEKGQHRVKITSLYNKFLEKADESISPDAKIATSAFKIKRIADEDTDTEQVESSNEDIEKQWRKERATNLKKEIAKIDLELSELRNQGKIKNLTSYVRNLTEDRIESLNAEKTELQKELNKNVTPQGTKK